MALAIKPYKERTKFRVGQRVRYRYVIVSVSRWKKGEVITGKGVIVRTRMVAPLTYSVRDSLTNKNIRLRESEISAK